jgi:hypothetical protein
MPLVVPPLEPGTQDVEIRACRIHPRVEHPQRAVCRFDATPYQDGRPACGCSPHAPNWRCLA